MPVFTHVHWGYQLHYPDNWIHKQLETTDGFALKPEALEPDYNGMQSGHLLVRAEWNGTQQPIEPLWNKHIGLVAGLIGAKKIGVAPWKMGDANGFEAEIVLPKRENMRIWTGILQAGFIVLHMMVGHQRDERSAFEKPISEIIKSLQFVPTVGNITYTHSGIPLPPNYQKTDPVSVIDDIANPENWLAYEGVDQIGALQAFFLREIPASGWNFLEFLSFPGNHELGFARISITKDNSQATIGLMPQENFSKENTPANSNPAKIIIKHINN